MSHGKRQRGTAGPTGGFSHPASDIDAVSRAEAVVAAFADEYLGWLGDDLDRLDEMLAAARDNPSAIDQLRRKAHDIRGQGGSFGFPLITKAAGVLHKVVMAQQDGLTEQGVALAREAVSAMRKVVERRASGEGDAVTRAAIEAVVRSAGSVSGGA